VSALWNHPPGASLEAGFLELDNGACERSLKPVAIGRKNCLSAGSDEGGRTAAVLMSVCTTCKELGIEPHAYFRVLPASVKKPSASCRFGREANGRSGDELRFPG
jgi:hypothetical protein